MREQEAQKRMKVLTNEYIRSGMPGDKKSGGEHAQTPQKEIANLIGESGNARIEGHLQNVSGAHSAQIKQEKKG